MDIITLQKAIREEQAELDAIATERPSTIESFSRYEELRQRLVSHEREFCIALMQEVAMPITCCGVKWDKSHQNATLVSCKGRSFLIIQHDIDSNDNMYSLGEIRECVTSTLTRFDYDAIEEHPLFHSGLEGLGAYFIQFSRWTKSLGITDPSKMHLLFCFESAIIECIAKDIKEISRARAFRSILQDLVSELS